MTSAGILSGVWFTKSSIGPTARNIRPKVTQLRVSVTTTMSVPGTHKPTSGVVPIWVFIANATACPTASIDLGISGDRDCHKLSYLNAAPFRTFAGNVSDTVRLAGSTTLTLPVSGKTRQQPISVTLRHRSGGLNEKVWQESRRIKTPIPVDLSRTVFVESDLHDDGPDVDREVEHDNSNQTELGATALG